MCCVMFSNALIFLCPSEPLDFGLGSLHVDQEDEYFAEDDDMSGELSLMCIQCIL